MEKHSPRPRRVTDAGMDMLMDTVRGAYCTTTPAPAGPACERGDSLLKIQGRRPD